MQMLRSIVFTVWLFVSVPFYVLALLLLAPLPHRMRYPIAVAWVRQVMWVMRHLVGLDYRVLGRENIPVEASVVLLKHSSTLETLAELLLFPPQTWVLKRELMFAPFFGWGIALLKPIAINRGAGRSAVREVISQGGARLREGIWVMIFPEGTRMPAGQTRRYGVSGAALAAATGRKIVPVAHDAGHYWPRRGWLKKPGTVTFVIGEPVDAQGRDPREVNREIQDWIEKTIRNIGDIAASAAEAERDAAARCGGTDDETGEGGQAQGRRSGPADKHPHQGEAGEAAGTDGAEERTNDRAASGQASRPVQTKRPAESHASCGSADASDDLDGSGASEPGRPGNHGAAESGQTSRLETASALSSMNSRRGST